jgi:hypothetical protein
MHSHELGDISWSSTANIVDGILYNNILVQQYLEPQMVIAGRSSYLRLWLLVTSVSPLRAYLFKGGFAIFGKQKGGSSSNTAATAASAAANSSSGSSTDDLIVNLWIQNREKSPIWSLQQLEQHLDKHPELVLPLPTEQQQQQRRTFADAWSDMQRSASLVLAASLPAMREAAANASAPPQGTFEYFGLDYVLDAHMRPWLLEVNAIPSMARRKKGTCVGKHATAACKLMSAPTNRGSSSSSKGGVAAAAADDFDDQKEFFMHDMLVLLGLPVDPPAAAAAAGGGDGLALLRKSAAAAAAAGVGTGSSSSSSSSGGARKLLEQWLGSRRSPVHVERKLQQVVEPDRSVRRHRHHSRDASMTAAGPRQPGKPAAAAADASASQQQQAAGKEQQDQGTKQQQQQPGALGLQSWEGPVPKFTELPAEVQAALCSSSSSSSSGSGHSFGCISCLTADDVAALAAAEAELQRAARFEPVYDVITAHGLSSRSAGPLPPDAAAGGAAGANGSSSAGVDTPSSAAAAAAAVLSGEEYLIQERSVWQKLHDTWLALSTSGVGLRDLELMKFYTTASKVAAGQQLQLTRQDYIMSAWLRVRQQLLRDAAECKQSGGEGGGGGALGGRQQVLSAGCVVRMLKQLVSQCYIQ